MSASPGGEKGCSPRPPLIHKVGGKRKRKRKRGKCPFCADAKKGGKGKKEDLCLLPVLVPKGWRKREIGGKGTEN